MRNLKTHFPAQFILPPFAAQCTSRETVNVINSVITTDTVHLINVSLHHMILYDTGEV